MDMNILLGMALFEAIRSGDVAAIQGLSIQCVSTNTDAQENTLVQRIGPAASRSDGESPSVV